MTTGMPLLAAAHRRSSPHSASLPSRPPASTEICLAQRAAAVADSLG